MAFKRWILLAGALCSLGSQVDAGEIFEADLKPEEIVLAQQVLANCQAHQPEVRAWLADYDKKMEADKYYEIDLIEQARIIEKLLVPFAIPNGTPTYPIQGLLWADAIYGCRYQNALKITYVYVNYK